MPLAASRYEEASAPAAGAQGDIEAVERGDSRCAPRSASAMVYVLD